jgi:hypothetical protein
MRETWKDIPGYEGRYQVSDLGRVKALQHSTLARNRWGDNCLRVYPEKILKQTINEQRMNRKFVILHSGKKQKMCFVAWLVAAAFLGPRPNKHHVCHNNGDATDDRLCNLRYGTPQENAYDKRAHGTHLQGDRHKGTKIPDADIPNIVSSNTSSKELAEMYGVHPGHINNIRRGAKRALA